MRSFLFIGITIFFAYMYGFYQGQNSEELKNARSKITVLERTIQEFKEKQTSDALALAELRIAESNSRNELDRMREQLNAIERVPAGNTNKQLNQCLRGRIETQEVAERLARAVKYCSENHK